jgi:hypothetical protein
MALYFSKAMGSKDMVESIHFKWHTKTSLWMLSLLLHNYDSLLSSFSKHLFRWIRVVT